MPAGRQRGGSPLAAVASKRFCRTRPDVSAGCKNQPADPTQWLNPWPTNLWAAALRRFSLGLALETLSLETEFKTLSLETLVLGKAFETIGVVASRGFEWRLNMPLVHMPPVRT